MKTFTIITMALGGQLVALKLFQSVLMYYGMSFEATRWIICPLGFWMMIDLFWYFTPEENKQWFKNTWLPKRKQDTDYTLPQDHNINISKYTTDGNTYYVMRVTNETGKEYLSIKSADLKSLQDKQKKMQQ